MGNKITMKLISAIALVAVQAIRVTHGDLPHTGSVDTNGDNLDKLDPMSRYVNDDNLVQVSYNDLPHTGSVDTNADNLDKLDPMSRYVNDDNIVQLKDETLVQTQYNDLPHTGS